MIKLVYGIKLLSLIFRNNEVSFELDKEIEEIYFKSKTQFSIFGNKDNQYVVLGLSLVNNDDGNPIEIDNNKMNEFSNNEVLMEHFGVLMEPVIKEWWNYYNDLIDKLKNKGVDKDLIRKTVEYYALPETISTKWYIVEDEN